MSKQDNLTDFLTDVADAIREKKGSSEKINPQNFSEEIRSIESGEVTEVNTFGEVMVDKTGKGIKSFSLVTLDDSITSIVPYAYARTNLQEMILPNQLKTIGEYAFYEAASLNTIVFNDKIESIGQYAFSTCNLTSVVIPDSVTVCGRNAFHSNKNLSHIEISKNMKELPWSFVFGCSSLKEITIPDNITYMNQYAVAETGIVLLNIPHSVEKMDRFCFQNCYALKACIFSEHESVPVLTHVNAFTGTTCKIVVPDALYDEWIVATNWSTYANRIIKVSEYVEPTTE